MILSYLIIKDIFKKKLLWAICLVMLNNPHTGCAKRAQAHRWINSAQLDIFWPESNLCFRLRRYVPVKLSLFER